MCMTLVRNSCSTDLERDISFIKSFILSCFYWVISSYANKQTKRKKGCAVHFYSQTTMNHFRTKKGKIAFDRSQSQAPRPHWWNRKLHRLFQNSSPCFHMFSIHYLVFRVSIGTKRKIYMFYTDKCHLVRTTNIAKFNYNEIPYAYTTSFGKY